MSKSLENIQLIRPEPIISELDVFPFNKKTDAQMAVETLEDESYVLILDYYSSGLKVLNELKIHLKERYSNQDFQGQRQYRNAYQKLSNLILVEVSNHRLCVKKSPEIGWFKILYPEYDNFLLSFPQVQGLNSAWQWFEKGISIPVLSEKLHPYFGVYFPTRFEHLLLFDEWMQEYKGSKNDAFDIGTGSGILSFLMLKHGFGKIYATDTNPNAIIGISESLKSEEEKNIELYYGDLFADCSAKSDLIVFNPPWIPTSYNSDGIDNAIYYDKELFPRFFAEAQKHLNEDGKLIIIFSNLAQITNQEKSHPVKYELENEGRFKKELLLHKKVNLASERSKRNQNWRSDEKVELWVLKLNNKNI